jgi:nucleoside-diphosphate-sugar epimerase
MRVVVVGATGNVGTSVLSALEADASVESVLGLARRLPDAQAASKVGWARADIVADDLRGHFDGADVVVHLAWAIQPSRDEAKLRAINVGGSSRVFAAVEEAAVPALVYASSVGAYSPGPKDRRVDESWPTGGISTSFYSRHKAETERMLDRFEREHPDIRVVRLRPALIFKREAASGIRRLFAGPLLPSPLVRPGLLPVLPFPRGLRLQAVHSLDVAEAYRLAVTNPEARGAYNVAAEPVIDAGSIGEVLGSRVVPVPGLLARVGLTAAWRLHLVPAEPALLDLALQLPLLDTTRIRTELGWSPTVSSFDALREVLEGMADGAGAATAPLAPDSLTGRLQEGATGIGERST